MGTEVLWLVVALRAYRGYNASSEYREGHPPYDAEQLVVNLLTIIRD